MNHLIINAVAILLLIISNLSFSQVTDTIESPITKIDSNKYKLGNLIIDKDVNEIVIPGKINMQKGMVEVFACSPGGKLHESIIELDIVPYYLQVGLLLLGLDPVESKIFDSGEDLSKYSQLEILVKWREDDSEKIFRAEELVWDITNKKTMQQTNWIFRGSLVIEGNFVANEIKSLITTYNDPTTIIDNPLISGKNDELYEANSNLIPPVGTNVKLIIRKL